MTEFNFEPKSISQSTNSSFFSIFTKQPLLPMFGILIIDVVLLVLYSFVYLRLLLPDLIYPLSVFIFIFICTTSVAYSLYIIFKRGFRLKDRIIGLIISFYPIVVIYPRLFMLVLEKFNSYDSGKFFSDIVFKLYIPTIIFIFSSIIYYVYRKLNFNLLRLIGTYLLFSVICYVAVFNAVFFADPGVDYDVEYFFLGWVPLMTVIQVFLFIQIIRLYRANNFTINNFDKTKHILKRVFFPLAIINTLIFFLGTIYFIMLMYAFAAMG